MSTEFWKLLLETVNQLILGEGSEQSPAEPVGKFYVCS